MKFFSAAWCKGQLANATAAARLEAYWKHVDTLAARLPATVYALGKGVNIHDGRFRAVQLIRLHRRIEMTLRCGDNQVGYFDLTLGYGFVDLRRTDTTVMKRIVDDPACEVLYDEIDVTGRGDDQYCVHRVICWPGYREFDIVFRTLRMRLEPRAGRAFGRRTPVASEIGITRPNRRLQPTAAGAIIGRRG